MSVTKFYSKSEKHAFNYGYNRGKLNLLLELIGKNVLDYATAVEMVKKLDMDMSIENRIDYISCSQVNNECGKDNILAIDEYVTKTIAAINEMNNKQISIIKAKDDNGYYLGIVFNDITHIAFINDDRFNFSDLCNALNTRGIDNWSYDIE